MPLGGGRARLGVTSWELHLGGFGARGADLVPLGPTGDSVAPLVGPGSSMGQIPCRSAACRSWASWIHWSRRRCRQASTRPTRGESRNVPVSEAEPSAARGRDCCYTPGARARLLALCLPNLGAQQEAALAATPTTPVSLPTSEMG